MPCIRICICVLHVCVSFGSMTKRAASHFDYAYTTFSTRCVWKNWSENMIMISISTLREWGMHVELCVSARGSRIQGRPIWLICVYHMPWHFVTDHLFKYIHAHPCMYCPYWVELPVGTSVQRHIVRDDLTLCRCVPSHMMQLSCLFYFLEY